MQPRSPHYVFTHFTNSYDIESHKVLNAVKAHKDDINSVAWDNKNLSHIVYTGSDDCNIFVWDRRTVGSSKKPERVLIGHQEGITNIASQGDSIHLISNGKDQLLKYWDIRMSHPITKLQTMTPLKRQKHFDYRYQAYTARYPKHPADCSVKEFKGHSILNTLIRCDFSPAETTGQRYVYSGSAAGSVFIYDLLTQNKVKELKLDLNARDIIEEYDDTSIPIRDVSWHPKYALIAATAFDGQIYLWNYKISKEREDSK